MTGTGGGSPKPPKAGAADGKRYAKRARRRLMVRYGTGAPEHTAFTKNLSGTGMFLQTNSVFRPGTTLQVQIQFPDRTFSHWARVVWAKKVPVQLAHILECGMGLAFIDPTEEWLAYFESWKKKAGVV